MKLRLALLPLLLIATACVGDSRRAPVSRRDLARQAEPPPDPGQRTPGVPRVVFLGDSLTYGQGMESRDDAWPALVAARLEHAGVKIQALNAGISGDNTNGGLERLPGLLALKPDVLVVALGGNDAIHGNAVGRARENLTQIVSQSQKAGAKVLVAGLHLPRRLLNRENGSFDELWIDVGSDLGAPVIPNMMDGVWDTPGMVQSDGVHPTLGGQQRIALNVEPYLREVLDDMRLQAPQLGTL